MKDGCLGGKGAGQGHNGGDFLEEWRREKSGGKDWWGKDGVVEN